MYKIFINEYPLIITGTEQDYFSAGNFRMVEDNPAAIASAVEVLENTQGMQRPFGLIVISERAEVTFQRFATAYRGITAAGGMVYNEYEELLLMLRQGKWDLPKGKVDKGETVEEAAVREVMEECGITRIDLGPFLGRSYHTYTLDAKKILKTTHWFRMTAREYRSMKPQKEENITQLKWVLPREINLETLDTYNSIRELLKEHLNSGH